MSIRSMADVDAMSSKSTALLMTTDDDEPISTEHDDSQVWKKQSSCWGTWFLPRQVRSPLLSVVDISSSGSEPPVTVTFSVPSEANNILSDQLGLDGIMLEDQGKLDEARVAYEECFTRWSTFEKCFSRRSSFELGNFHYRIGVLHWKRCAYGESLQHLDHAIRIYGRDGTTPCSVMAEVFIAKGRAHLSIGDHRSARKCFKHSVFFLKSPNQELSTQAKQLFAKATHALGMTYEAIGKYERALEHCQAALALQRQVKREAGTDVATTLATFGSLYEKMGQYDLALSCLTEAYYIFLSNASNGSSPVDIGVVLANVGWIQFVRGNFVESLRVYEDALRFLRPLGAHRNVASVMIQIGMVYVQQGLNEQAVSLYKEALNIQRLVLRDDHEDVTIALSALSSAKESIGRQQEAVEIMVQERQIRRHTLGEIHSHVGETKDSVTIGRFNERGARVLQAKT